MPYRTPPHSPEEPNVALLLTKSDADYAASVLSSQDKDHVYSSGPRHLVAEGADFGVFIYERTSDNRAGRYVGHIDVTILLKMCSHRPVVPIEKSYY